ncbi:hypothetical protein OH77DRAFT_1022381 [Trametes cingulata]|nr:hypothetical protein OH77DRAFT_1022381 [Trametes cingulata]
MHSVPTSPPPRLAASVNQHHLPKRMQRTACSDVQYRAQAHLPACVCLSLLSKPSSHASLTSDRRDSCGSAPSAKACRSSTRAPPEAVPVLSWHGARVDALQRLLSIPRPMRRPRHSRQTPAKHDAPVQGLEDVRTRRTMDRTMRAPPGSRTTHSLDAGVRQRRRSARPCSDAVGEPGRGRGLRFAPARTAALIRQTRLSRHFGREIPRRRRAT